MEARIQVSGEDEIDEITDLWEWLGGERELTGRVRALPSLPGEGELGGAIDVLAVALGAGGAGTVLVQSLMAWLRTRRPSIEVTVKANGRTVTVKASDHDPDAIIPLLRQALSDDQTDDDD